MNAPAPTLTELIERYAAGSQRLREAVAGLTPEQLASRPIAGKWSTLEVVAHLADFELIGAERIASVTAEDEPTLPGRDETRYAARLAYDRRDFDEQLQIVDLVRRHVVRILQTLTEADLARRGVHTEAGPLLLSQLIERVTRHLEHHVPFIEAKRRALEAAASPGAEPTVG